MDGQSATRYEIFQQYLATHEPSGPIAEIAQLLATDDLTESGFDDVCNRNKKTPDDQAFKGELLDLLLYCISCCLGDHELSPVEDLDIKELKMLLRIKEGDLYTLRRDIVKELLSSELGRIFEDRQVDAAESLKQVDLQALFDLSYDQYLDLTRDQVQGIVDQVMARITADSVVTDLEREELFKQVLALDTVYLFKDDQRAIIYNRLSAKE